MTKTVLLTGASGFVGSHVHRALAHTDWTVVAGSRNPDAARRRTPGHWVDLDVSNDASVEAAMQGCRAAIYLVHSIDEGGDYPEREADAARRFRNSAAKAGLERLIYLGGVAPSGTPSRHLASRIRTGDILRRGDVPTIELRAAMVVGAGGSSWLMVRDLAKRLPAMLLPRWLKYSSWPISIEDVVVAIMGALDVPLEDSVVYDVPGPERVTHRELLAKVARAMGKDPTMVGVPVITPRLSSYWIALVTRASLPLARELVQGLQSDLDPTEASWWEATGAADLVPLDTAIKRALEDEHAREFPNPALISRVLLRVLGDRAVEEGGG